MGVLHSLDHDSWTPKLTGDAQASATRALEMGAIVILPRLPFALKSDEQYFLSPKWTDGKAKNVSFDPANRAVRHTSAEGADKEALGRMIGRFSDNARGLVDCLFPLYGRGIRFGLTSYRPVEAAGRGGSKTKDDTRVHVDAFVSRPNQGERIMRVFSNINPQGRPREWIVGEPFADQARQFLPKIAKPTPGSAYVMKALGITKGLRTPYDHYMLQLHDRAKLDEQYQESCPKTPISIPAGATWIVFTDLVSHAVISGQYVLEQTFYLPVAAMQEPILSPLKTLERMVGRELV